MDTTQPHASCGSSLEMDPWLPDLSPDCEQYWCPWFYSDFVIPDLPPFATPMNTCTLPPYSHCPGPLLDFSTPAVNRPPALQALTTARPDLALLNQAVRSSGIPNYRGACHQHPGLEVVESPFHKPLPHQDTRIRFPHRLHISASSSFLPGEPPFGHPLPAGCHSLHHQGTQTLRHPRALRLPPLRLANFMMTRPRRIPLNAESSWTFPCHMDGASTPESQRLPWKEGVPFKLKVLNPAMLAQKILKYVKGCLLYKVDVRRAYRQLRTD